MPDSSEPMQIGVLQYPEQCVSYHYDAQAQVRIQCGNLTKRVFWYPGGSVFLCSSHEHLAIFHWLSEGENNAPDTSR